MKYSGTQPKGGYFTLSEPDEMFNALYSMLTTTAINRYIVEVTTLKDIKTSEHANVKYMAVNW